MPENDQFLGIYPAFQVNAGYIPGKYTSDRRVHLKEYETKINSDERHTLAKHMPEYKGMLSLYQIDFWH